MKAITDLSRASLRALRPMRIAPVLSLAAAAFWFQAAVCQAQCPTVPQWKQIGPAPLKVDSQPSTDGLGPNSGLVRDIAIDPLGTSDQTIYLATDNGGIWKTTDGGVTFFPKTDFMPSLNMGAVALDPANPSIVYAGTGNELNQNFLIRGAGIYKSLDGGESWMVLGGSTFTNAAINRIVVPAPNVLLVASSNGLYQSFDGGTNFVLVFVGGGDWTDLDIDTASATTVYASVANLGVSGGVYKLVNAGSTFTSAGNLFTTANGAPVNPGYIAFAQSTAPDNQTMYVNVALQGGSLGMYKSNDGGTNWTSVFLGLEVIAQCSQCGYDQTIGVDPQDSNRVYFGMRGLYLSTDGGASGLRDANSAAKLGFPNPTGQQNRIDEFKVHGDHHALVFSPLYHRTGTVPTRVFIGTDGGFATTADSGTNWTLLNGSANCFGPKAALATVLFRRIDIGRGSTANNRYTYGAAQDLGISSHRADCAGTPWRQGIGGDGSTVAVDPRDPTHAIGEAGGFTQSTPDGNSWPNVAAGLPAAPSQVHFDPNGGVAYASAGVPVPNTLYQSLDNGTNFAAIHTFSVPFPVPFQSPFNAQPAFVSTISIARADANVMWVGLADGTVQRSANVLSGANSAWVPIVVSGSTFPTWVSGVAVDPVNTDQAVVVYPYSGPSQQAFFTRDNGTNWSDISGNLPRVPLRAVVIDPNTSPHAIIVATDAGVMRTLNQGVTWEAIGAGLPTVQCTSLALDSSATPSLLRVGTYGRSAWELAYDRQYVAWWALSYAQDGTRELPFKTVTQAANAAPSGDAKVIVIQGGDYHESPLPLRITQCCTLMAVDGPAIIH